MNLRHRLEDALCVIDVCIVKIKKAQKYNDKNEIDSALRVLESFFYEQEMIDNDS